MVLPSVVYRYGTALGPVLVSLTLHSLYLASWAVILCTVNLPFTMVSTSLAHRAYFRRFLMTH